MDERSLYDTWDDIAAHRAVCPFGPREQLGGYEALTYDTIVSVLREPTTFSNCQVTFHPLEPSLASMDPPEHTPVRRALLGAFSKGAVAALEPGIRADAHDLVDGLPEAGTVVEVKRDYAVALALRTIMRLMRSAIFGTRPRRSLFEHAIAAASDEFFVRLR